MGEHWASFITKETKYESLALRDSCKTNLPNLLFLRGQITEKQSTEEETKRQLSLERKMTAKKNEHGCKYCLKWLADIVSCFLKKDRKYKSGLLKRKSRQTIQIESLLYLLSGARSNIVIDDGKWVLALQKTRTDTPPSVANDVVPPAIQKPLDPMVGLECTGESGVRPPNTLRIPISSDKLKELVSHQSPDNPNKHKYIKLPIKKCPNVTTIISYPILPRDTLYKEYLSPWLKSFKDDVQRVSHVTYFRGRLKIHLMNDNFRKQFESFLATCNQSSLDSKFVIRIHVHSFGPLA
ncbi:hypothetical protein ACOME3_008782 [Neoechinorhynchus agilis]